MFNGLKGKQIEDRIIPRKGSKVRGVGSARGDAVRAVRKKGKRRYKQEIGYSRKNALESFLQFLRAGLERVQ